MPRSVLRPWRHLLLVLGFALSSWALATAAPPEDLALDRIDLADHRGRSWSLDELLDQRAADGQGIGLDQPPLVPADAEPGELLIVAFLGTECPLAKHYSVRLDELAAEYAGRGVRLVGVVSNRQDSLEKIAAMVRDQRLRFPLLKDPGNRLADRLGAERTPEVFLFDADRRLRYWGRVDDAHGIGYARDEPNRHDLREAIDQLLAGDEVSVPVTRSVGCLIGRTKPVDPEADVTYTGGVAEILQRRCLECHRDGEIGPFSVEDPHEVAGWAEMIAEVVRQRRMPPWHASPEHGEFANDRSMPEDEKQLLYRWAEAGAPLGDLEAQQHLLPEPPTFVAGWQLPREPDLVVEVSPEPFQVPATGTVRYQYFKVDPGLEEDVWLEAAEFLPGNRAVVHHILGFSRPRGSEGGLEGARGFLVGYVPGARNEPWPAGMAKRIPGGSELIFQVHYTPIGTPQTDHSKLGLCFADPESITHEVRTGSALQTKLAIPPGETNYVADAFAPAFQTPALLLGMSPHMHVRGKSFRYELHRTDGGRQTLLDIPEYDFNWQTTYVPRQPLPLQPGDRIFCTASYDNSSGNLNNPDPTVTVRWGDQTWDEMMIGYFHYAVARQDDEAAESVQPTRRAETRAGRAAAVAVAARLRRFDQLDVNGDGRLKRDAVPAELLPIFDRLDANGDGVLTRQEVVRGGR